MRPWILAIALLLPLPLGAQPASVQRDSQAAAEVARRYLVATWVREYAVAGALLDRADAVQLRGWIVRELEREAEGQRMFRAMRDSMNARLARARTRADTNRIVGERSTSSSIAQLTLSDTQATPAPPALDTGLARRHGATVLQALPGSPTLASMLALPDSAFMIRVLEGSMDYRIPGMPPGFDSLRHVRTPSGQRPGIRVVGVVFDHDSVAHVLYRPTMPTGEEIVHWGSGELGTMDVGVLQLRRRPAGWRVRLPDEQVQQLRSALAMSRVLRARDARERGGAR